MRPAGGPHLGARGVRCPGGIRPLGTVDLLTESVGLVSVSPGLEGFVHPLLPAEIGDLV